MIVIVSFSNHSNGNCVSIGNEIVKQYHHDQIQFYDLSRLSLNRCGNCHYECFKDNNQCLIDDDLEKIYQSIIDSTMTVFILPNYCGYPPSNYYIFNERSCGFFNKSADLLERYLAIKKKFIVISNTEIDHIKEALKYQIEDDNPQILLLSPKKFDKASLSGDLMESQDASKLVIAFIADNYILEESAMAIVFYQNQILVTREEIYGKMILSLPKGHLKTGETHLQASIRECFEETDIVLTIDDYVKEVSPFEYTFIDHHKQLIKKIIYPIVYHLQTKLTPNSKEERVKEALFMDVNLFLLKCSYENVRTIVNKIKR